jgi:hypothetical protein
VHLETKLLLLPVCESLSNREVSLCGFTVSRQWVHCAKPEVPAAAAYTPWRGTFMECDVMRFGVTKLPSDTFPSERWARGVLDIVLHTARNG